jgi:hypothetical protein
MENVYARRNFLKNVALVSTGVAFLSSTTIGNAFSKEECPYDGYNPYAAAKADMRLSSLFGNHVKIEGQIFDKISLNEISTATVEVWHLSPDSQKYRHQAKLKVNQNGAYSILTDLPNKEQGRLPKVFFKITVNDRVYFTELAIASNNAYINHKHYEDNLALGSELFPTHQVNNNLTTIKFNIAV